MKQLTLFRILTFVLLPAAAFFGFMAFLFLFTALANPALLLIVFLFACMAIYTFASYRFLSNGIDKGKPCKPSLRDWIRVNAYVSIFISVLFLTNSISMLLMNPVTLREMVTQMLEMQPNLPSSYNTDFFLHMLKIVSGFLLFFSLVLLVHIFINFKLMKRYGHLFHPGQEQE